MPGEQAGKVLELVIFKLKEGVTREQFMATVDAVSDWLRAQPGFVSRELSYAESEAQWIDIVWWRSMEEARAAGQAALSAPACGPMFSLIEEDGALMLHGVPAIAPVTR
jgi:hypothetical protein